MDFDLLAETPFDFNYASSAASIGPLETNPSELDKTPSDSPPEDVELATVSTSSSSGDLSVAKVRRKPMPRKGHTKSRRGCFSCKKRKVKCQETLPKCENCVKADMTCEYPRREINSSHQAVVGQNPIMQPQGTATIFNINDMRFFHLFLTKAYPHLPVGADELWTLDLPAQAHECNYLMHSMLALGASHLSTTSTEAVAIREQALVHRVKAVNGLNEAFLTPIASRADADARFATLMNLTFQSAYITDGLQDFMTMLRGCVLQGAVCDTVDTAFKAMEPRDHVSVMTSRFAQMDVINMTMDTKDLDRGLDSLNALAPYCKEGVETMYLNLLKSLVQMAYTSPPQSYFALTDLYNILGILPPDEFKNLMDPTNSVCRVLIGHFLAVHVITRPIALIENPNRDASVMYDMLETWVCLLHAGLDSTFRRLHEWPMKLIREAALHGPISNRSFNMKWTVP